MEETYLKIIVLYKIILYLNGITSQIEKAMKSLVQLGEKQSSYKVCYDEMAEQWWGVRKELLT